MIAAAASCNVMSKTDVKILIDIKCRNVESQSFKGAKVRKGVIYSI